MSGPERPSGRAGALPCLGAAAVVLACLAANLWYIRSIQNPPSFDNAWYLENSFRFYYALKEQGPLAFFKAYAGSFRFKAPLIAVLPMPLYFLFGPSMRAALAVNLAAVAALGFYTYRLGARYGRTAGLLATAIAMTLPMLFGLSRVFLVEYALAALVAAWAHHWLASESLSRPGSEKILGVLLGLGLLAKSLFPFYLLGPVAEGLWSRCGGRGAAFWREAERPVKTVLYIGGAIALTWYANNLVYTAGYMLRASVGDIAADYGSTRVWSPSVVLAYWLAAVNDGVSPYYFLSAAGAALILALRSGRPAGDLRAAWRGDPVLRALALWLLLPMAVATFGVNKDVRLLAPCLPAFAVLLARGLDLAVPPGRFRAAALGAWLLFPANQYAFQTFGVSALPPMRLGPLALLQPSLGYSGPPTPVPSWNQEALVDALNRECGGRPAAVVVGLEHPRLNANNLAYFSALKNYPLTFVSYGYGESRVERALARFRDKDAEYLLLVRGVAEGEIPENVRRLDAQLRRLIDRGSLPFKPVREFRLTQEITAALYRRAGLVRIVGAPS